MMAKAERLRISIDSLYLEALGRAAYTFAVLEWNAVWCCEQMQKGYIQKLQKKTAGVIATDFVAMVKKQPKALRDACLRPAEQFQTLVEIRNGILHGKPGTAPGGAQRLFRQGKPWTPEMLDDAADKFAATSILLNAILYNQLKATP